MKKTKLFLLLIAFSCGEKQDYENDIKIPTILKDYSITQKEKAPKQTNSKSDYSITQKEEVPEKTNSRSKSDTSSSPKKIRTYKGKMLTNEVGAIDEADKEQ